MLFGIIPSCIDFKIIFRMEYTVILMIWYFKCKLFNQSLLYIIDKIQSQLICKLVFSEFVKLFFFFVVNTLEDDLVEFGADEL